MYLTSALVRLGERWPPVGLTVAEAVVCALPVIPDLGPGRIPAGTCSAPSSRGLGRRPLKAVTPIRIRSGLHSNTSRACTSSPASLATRPARPPTDERHSVMARAVRTPHPSVAPSPAAPPPPGHVSIFG